MDDIIVFSSMWEEHLKSQTSVDMLAPSQPVSRAQKVPILSKQVEYLSHVIEGGGILPNPKIEAVHHYKHPEIKTEPNWQLP